MGDKSVSLNIPPDMLSGLLNTFMRAMGSGQDGNMSINLGDLLTDVQSKFNVKVNMNATEASPAPIISPVPIISPAPIIPPAPIISPAPIMSPVTPIILHYVGNTTIDGSEHNNITFTTENAHKSIFFPPYLQNIKGTPTYTYANFPDTITVDSKSGLISGKWGLSPILPSATVTVKDSYNNNTTTININFRSASY